MSCSLAHLKPLRYLVAKRKWFHLISGCSLLYLSGTVSWIVYSSCVWALLHTFKPCSSVPVKSSEASPLSSWYLIILSAITAEYRCPIWGAESNGQQLILETVRSPLRKLAKFTCIRVENWRCNIKWFCMLPSALSCSTTLAQRVRASKQSRRTHRIRLVVCVLSTSYGLSVP